MSGMRLVGMLVLALSLAACGTGKQRASVVDRDHKVQRTVAAPDKTKRSGDWRPKVYVVQKGDTLYGIAFNHGMDYRELAEMNGIDNPSVIRVGQELKIASTAVDVKPPVAAVTEPVLKTEPKAIKLPYSAQSEAMLESGGKSDVVKPVVVAPVPVPKPEVRAEPEKAAQEVADDGAGGDDRLEWVLPARGKLIGEFSESASQKGMDIAGKRGQPIFASAAGRVVYSGSGLRGYGKLIIIKHNNTYISAYAHNDKILVKERDLVKKGQKIAEMGDSDSDQVKLHFEIRKFGKPVDPAGYLPKG